MKKVLLGPPANTSAGLKARGECTGIFVQGEMGWMMDAWMVWWIGRIDREEGKGRDLF
jgi:hypothetical protein